MRNEIIREKLSKIERDATIQNLMAQANARYILFNTAENRDNFPPYTINDSSLNILAFYYLNFGCSFAENNNFTEAVEPLEKGASLLEFIHSAESNKTSISDYYGLVAALSYYVSFQYSKSFILIKKFKSDSVIAKLIHLFLLRDFKNLIQEIGLILIDEAYDDGNIAQNHEEENINGQQKVYEIVIARALDTFIKYFYSGNTELLYSAKSQLRNLKEIAELESDPGIWWVLRLLILISDGFDQSSLWNSLSPHFDIYNPKVTGYIESLVYMQPRGIYELFVTQRKSLEKVLHNTDGCIVSIPTSSGKTRIAELSILDCIIKDPDNKILYVAPFRSLAFEVENSLGPILDNADISVSHLYGGSLYSKLDEKIIEDSNVIIATPEKAKAILRGNEELIAQIRLVIIDEGHLLGPEKRNVINEMFYEELRFYMDHNGGKFLLLSAVLPNSEDLAQWLTKSDQTIYKDKWRPSDERLGILEWNGRHVNLNWVSKDEERSSFNNRFIIAEEQPLTGRQTKIRYIPGSKNDAVAATAYKFRTFGSVLIFVGLKASVFVMARSYYSCLGTDPEDHIWKNTADWRAFELACIETYGDTQNPWLDFARKGILCHNSDLHSDVRLPLERLMRADKPLVIIATSTLGQGVNLGVSTVIFSTLNQAGSAISSRDFWNIAGRAGRAFVDHEGKILVALETAKKTPSKILRETRDIERKYFDKERIDHAKSGILSSIIDLKKLAENEGVNFDLLLELITENRIEEISPIALAIEDKLGCIDDTLLTLQTLNNPEDEINLEWTEPFFARSLAFIQAESETSISSEEVSELLQARIMGIVEKVGNDRGKWNSVVRSGLPLNTDLIIEERLDIIIGLVQDSYENDSTLVETKIKLLTALENILEDLPVLVENGSTVQSASKDEIRNSWIRGHALSEIFPLENATTIITKLYTFNLPWVLNGIAKKMRILELDEEAGTIEELSILVETGLPSLKKVKIYQAGIRSRSAANELGELFEDDDWDKSVYSYKRELIANEEMYKLLASANTIEWLELLVRVSTRRDIKVKKVPRFIFKGINTKTSTLVARQINGLQYLMSPDLKVIENVTKSEIDFTSVNDVAGIEFVYDDFEEQWIMQVHNPYVHLID
ncbi:DEAD/DEAH box helicase [Elizabethkingia anophelis]|uniref:DEAD/DEAH box helicase n=1 Tax=Elizabethkingia anophelis TaxID=1117645 RepID=UPI000B35A23B|nr:DEAD/DEAH box helicase [Elizabethkingia anophelis]